jgi:replicative DNA helicase
MTAAHRAELHVVPDSDTDLAPDEDFEPGDELRGQTIAAHWEPENQLIGALLWMPHTRARSFLELIPDTAIWGPLNRWVYELIRRATDARRDPDPVTVLAYGRQHAATEALDPARRPTAGQHHRLALHLADLYTHTLSADIAANHARDVLDEAYRRSVREHGIRMQQMADSGADRAAITEHFTAVRDNLADLWRRAETAGQPGWDPL